VRPSPYIQHKSRWPGIQKRGGIPINCADGQGFTVTHDLCCRFENDFQQLDVVRELMKLRHWCRKNNDKLVPREAIYGLIRSWLNRAEKRRIRAEHQRSGEADE